MGFVSPMVSLDTEKGGEETSLRRQRRTRSTPSACPPSSMECDDCSKAENVEKGSLREKFEYSSSDEKALSALFEEFGSSKVAYFEGRSNSQTKISVSVAGLLVGLILCLVR